MTQDVKRNVNDAFSGCVLEGACFCGGSRLGSCPKRAYVLVPPSGFPPTNRSNAPVLQEEGGAAGMTPSSGHWPGAVCT